MRAPQQMLWLCLAAAALLGCSDGSDPVTDSGLVGDSGADTLADQDTQSAVVWKTPPPAQVTGGVAFDVSWEIKLTYGSVLEQTSVQACPKGMPYCTGTALVESNRQSITGLPSSYSTKLALPPGDWELVAVANVEGVEHRSSPAATTSSGGVKITWITQPTNGATCYDIKTITGTWKLEGGATVERTFLRATSGTSVVDGASANPGAPGLYTGKVSLSGGSWAVHAHAKIDGQEYQSAPVAVSVPTKYMCD